jgi:hypothetical protein
MTIPAGGPVTGQGINAETGAASTAAVTVNDPYVRSIARKLTGDVLGSDFLGKFGFWIGFSSTATHSISVDGSGNVMVATLVSSSQGVQKYFLSIGLIYARSYAGSGFASVTQASDGTTLLALGAGSTSDGNLIKLSATGTMLWKRFYRGTPTATSGSIEGVVIDSTESNYYFICGPFDAAVDQYTTIVKVDSSGTLQWQVRKTLEQPTSGNLGIARDSSDNIYALSEQSSPKYVNLMKINSSGSLVWERNLSLSGFAVSMPTDQTIAVDASGNIYLVVLGHTSGNRTTVVKYNTSGVLQWQYATTLFPPGNNAAVTCDSSGNVYFLSIENAFPASNLYITKLTSAGSVSWQRILTGNPVISWTLLNRAATVDAYGNLVFLSSGYIFRLPSSGAGTGSYVINAVTVTYATTSLSLAAGALTDSAGSVGLSAVSNTFTTISTSSGTARTPTTFSVALNV